MSSSKKVNSTMKKRLPLENGEAGKESVSLNCKRSDSKKFGRSYSSTLPANPKINYFYDRTSSFKERSRSVFYREMSFEDIEENANKSLSKAPHLCSFEQLLGKSYVSSGVLNTEKNCTGKEQNLEQTDQRSICVPYLIDKFNKNCQVNTSGRSNGGKITTKSGQAVKTTLKNVITTKNVATNTELTTYDEIFHDHQNRNLQNDDFGLISLNEDNEDNYIVEAFKKKNNELVITYIELKKKTINLSQNEGNNLEQAIQKLEKDLQNLAKESEIIFHSDNGKDVKYIENNDMYTKYSEPLYYEIESIKKNLIDTEGNVRVQWTDQPKRNKLYYIIEELIETEKQYVAGLEKIVCHYKPHVEKNAYGLLAGKSWYLFGNIESIYEEHKTFLFRLLKCNEDVQSIAQLFLDSESMLKLYPKYSKNKPKADVFLREFREILRPKQEELGDRLDLTSYLLTPIQRLGKYVLLLENINKELKKQNITITKVSQAVDMIKTQMKKGNDYIAIDSIQYSPLALSDYGSFIMRGEFNVLKPRKFESMVFYFENVIVITQKAMKTREEFHYVDSIQINDLTIGSYEQEPFIFHLIDYPKCKKDSADRHTFVLEAKTKKIKEQWVDELAERLWAQLRKVKDELEEKRQSLVNKESDDEDE